MMSVIDVASVPRKARITKSLLPTKMDSASSSLLRRKRSWSPYSVANLVASRPDM